MSFSIALLLTVEAFLTEPRAHTLADLPRQISLVMTYLCLWNPRIASMCLPPYLPNFDYEQRQSELWSYHLSKQVI